MKTMLIELRYHSEAGIYEPYDDLVDGINEIIGVLASRFSLDLLSISHVVEAHPADHTSITCTAICALNTFTREHIGMILEVESHRDDSNLLCLLEAHKLSVRVREINS